jgi:hypothetical protein
VINRPKAKKERIALLQSIFGCHLMRGPRRRLPSSADAPLLPRRRFGGLKKTGVNLAISAHSMSASHRVLAN